MKMRATLAIVLFAPVVLAQKIEKKPLSHDVYDGWREISGESITANGKWVSYALQPQEGDGQLVIVRPADGKADTISKGVAPRFTADSRFVVFKIRPIYTEVRKLKIAKKKGDELPKDSLGIVDLGNDNIVRIARVKSFLLPEKSGAWLAYQLEKDTLEVKNTGKVKQSIRHDTDQAGDEKEAKEEKGTTLVARELSTGREFRFPFVREFVFAKDGKGLLFASTGNDSTVSAGVFLFYTSSQRTDTLSIGKGQYRQLALDETGTQAAFVADRDTSKAKQRWYTLQYWKEGQDSASTIADTLTPGLRKGWLISENGAVSFSKDGKRLFFGTAPVPMPEDTTFNEEETARLDIWNWQDEFLQSRQLKNLDAEKKRSYLAVVFPGSRRIAQLGDTEVPTVTTGDEGNAPVALGLSDVPYRREESWLGMPSYDAYFIDVNTGARTRVLVEEPGGASLSPSGRYIYWYDRKNRCWRTMPTEIPGKIFNLTGMLSVAFYDELFDMPEDPSPYGIAGWTERDSTLLIYDRYDIWESKPGAAARPVNITRESGRAHLTTYRYVRLDPEERFIPVSRPLLLRVFRNTDKSAGFATLRISAAGEPQHLTLAPYMYSSPVKAKDDTAMIFTRSSFREAPDLYYTRTEFRTASRLSDANPQQKLYLWGTVELTSWKDADGKPIDGLLYKPENFEPKKKYPMIVYFYERNSDLLHRYFPPAPSASTVNVSLFVSRGYVVFIPDIRYIIGHPGQSAMNAIIPGVKKLIAAGFVDPARIGIQGQSWGGYQVAFIVTRTGMFKAAMAGAAVSNMTSAYGGIRWESGMSRMFQYEKSQSRIGATLWEKPQLFIENSPLFSANHVTTPLLMMNNDADGAVPWYQGIEFFTALRRLNKPVWMLTYNNEAHNLVQRKNRKDLSIRMLQFFDHYLMGKPMPVWMEKGIPAINKWKTMGYELSGEK